MSTAIFDVAMSLPNRIDELQRLVNLADVTLKNGDELGYNSLCRACCVLLASHLEGFVKDLSKSLISDFNFNLDSFSKLPPAVKHTFCRRIAFFEGVPEQEVNLRTKQLMSFFDENSVAINMQAFPYKEAENKNPNGDVIESSLKKLGVPAVLFSISGGRFETVFSNDPSSIYLVRRDIVRFRNFLFRFPYRSLPDAYKFDYSGMGGKQAPTLWHSFINEIMKRRHTIVHGDTTANETTTAELRRDVEKLEVLMHAVLYSSTSYLVGTLK